MKKFVRWIEKPSRYFCSFSQITFEQRPNIIPCRSARKKTSLAAGRESSGKWFEGESLAGQTPFGRVENEELAVLKKVLCRGAGPIQVVLWDMIAGFWTAR